MVCRVAVRWFQQPGQLRGVNVCESLLVFRMSVSSCLQVASTQDSVTGGNLPGSCRRAGAGCS